MCEGIKCDFDSKDIEPQYCFIDTTSNSWNNPEAIIKGDPNLLKTINISFKLDPITREKVFLKYDYSPVKSCETTLDNTCTEQSIYSRFVNIRKITDKNGIETLNGDEAVVNVRVSWDSPLGPKNVDVQNFIYNISENL